MHVDKAVSGKQGLSFSPSGSMLVVGSGREVVIYKVGGKWEKVWRTTLSSHSLCFLWASDHLIVTEMGEWIDINQQTVGKHKFKEWRGLPWCMDIMREHQRATIASIMG